jgi:hypothetical protein
MIGLWYDIKGWIDLVVSLWIWLAIGGAIGFLGGLFRPWLGFPGVAIGGACIMFAFMLADWAGDNSFTVDKLKAENARLEAKQRELRYTAEALRKALKEEAEAQAENEETISRLKEKVGALPESGDCLVPTDIIEELNAIR